MWHDLLSLIPVVTSGALFRLRGSSTFAEWTGRGVTTARILWAAGTTLALWATFPHLMTLPVCAALPVALWAGCVLGWWRSLDMGTQTDTLARDMFFHSLRGLVWVLPAAAVVWFFGLGPFWTLLVAGALCGPIYALGFRIWTFRATQFGEWVFGSAVGASLVASFPLGAA